jgi:hypothetical protein
LLQYGAIPSVRGAPDGQQIRNLPILGTGIGGDAPQLVGPFVSLIAANDVRDFGRVLACVVHQLLGERPRVARGGILAGCYNRQYHQNNRYQYARFSHRGWFQLQKPESFLVRAVAHFSVFLRARVFTRENTWVIIVSVMLLLILILATMGTQPRFVYSGF